MFGNDSLSSTTSVSNSGNAIGVRINQGTAVQAITCLGGGIVATSATQATLAASELALVVGKITWGATPAAVDTIGIYTPGTNLALDTPQSATAVLDQSTFNVISSWGNGNTPNIDEIRFGATYADVIGQGIDTSGDITAPAPSVMSFATPPTAVLDSSITMTATAAGDANGVQYRFHNATRNTYSPWQDSPTFTDLGLTANTSYSYTVQARDKSVNQNTNTASSPLSATTLAQDTTASFTSNITANRTISLDTPRTIGNITFNDASNDLIIAGANTLTLDVPTGSPVIDVTQANRTLTMSSVITGNKGLQKNGSGILSLAATNTYTGTTSVTAGQLNFGNVSLSGFGGGSGRNISVATGASIMRSSLDNAFLNRIVENTNEFTLMTATPSNSLDFSSSTGANLPNAFLGNYAGNGAKCEYSGTLTPAADNYRLGGAGSNGLLGIRSTLTGARGIIVGGSGVRVNLVAADTCTGDTIITTGARLSLGNNLALQNSALNVGSAGGSFSCAAGTNAGRITGETTASSPTFGGLKGSRNLALVFSPSGGNNESNLAVTAVTGFTLNPGTGKTCSYSGAIANFASGTTLTKTGLGTQTLSGTNTYTGATNVNQGTLALVGGSHISPITVAGGASLGFTLGSPTTSTSSVDLTNGTVKITGAVNNASDYLLMTASTITGTPVLDAPIPNYQLQKAAGNTQLKLVYINPASAYDTWKATNAPSGTPEDDFDGDGVDNAVEFVLGGLASTRDLAKLPAVSTNGGNLMVTFKRAQASIDPMAAVTLQVGTNLAAWPDSYPVPDAAVAINPGVTVVKNSPAVGTDTVTLTLPRAADRSKFVRLRVIITP